MIQITDKAQKDLRHASRHEQQLFYEAIQRLHTASPLERQQLLSAVQSNKFKAAGVRWTMRANHKYRLLIDRSGEEYVVRGFVGRGDRRFYR